MSQSQNIIVSVDVALFTLKEGRLCIGLLKRDHEPFKDRFALPGGFVHDDKDMDMATTARRVLQEKIGISSPYLEQLYTFSGAVRDPRGWSLSVCYYALAPEEDMLACAHDNFKIVPVELCPSLPFDHTAIVRLALSRLRGKSTYSSLPAFLLGETFSLSELRNVYEHVMDIKLDKASFRKKIVEQEIIEPVEGEQRYGTHRPAQLYRLATTKLTEFERKIAISSSS